MTTAAPNAAESTWLSEWEPRFAAACRTANLSTLQEAVYRAHLQGKNVAQIADAVSEPLAPPRDDSRKARKSYLRRASLRTIAVSAALAQAEAKLSAAFPEFRAAGHQFNRQLINCARNRFHDWARVPILELQSDQSQPTPPVQMVAASELPRQADPDALRLHLRGLGAPVDRYVTA